MTNQRMRRWVHYLFRIMTVTSVSAFWVVSSGLGHAQVTPMVEKTTGPICGLSVEQQLTVKEYRVLWPGHRIIIGTEETVIGDLVKVNTGVLLPRFLSAKEAVDKGLPALKKGDQLQIAINDQNLAVIRTERDKEEAFSVRPLARSKVSAIPMNAPAVFLTKPIKSSTRRSVARSLSRQIVPQWSYG